MKIKWNIKNSNTPINCFAGASTKDMGHYSQPPLAEMVMINVDNNDFNSNCLLKKTANDIVNLATVMEKEIQLENAVISVIVLTSDQFEKPVNEVNKAVKELYVSRSL